MKSGDHVFDTHRRRADRRFHGIGTDGGPARTTDTGAMSGRCRSGRT